MFQRNRRRLVSSFSRISLLLVSCEFGALVSCSGTGPTIEGTGGDTASGGDTSVGGVGTIGSSGTQSMTSTGGMMATGGMVATGGMATGGVQATGGMTTGGTPTGGTVATGGMATGGMPTGGTVTTGGMTTGGMATGGTPTGGTVATGGMATGGMPTGGMIATGGMATGGMHATGGATSSGAPTFTEVYNSIISANCASCHSNGHSGFTSGMLDMSSQSAAYTNLVGVAAAGVSCGGGGRTRVVPGDHTTSLLWQKVNAKTTGGTSPCGSPMPLSATTLSSTQVAMIAAWIDAGALDN